VKEARARMLAPPEWESSTRQLQMTNPGESQESPCPARMPQVNLHSVEKQ
jgi:hypothetical protein